MPYSYSTPLSYGNQPPVSYEETYNTYPAEGKRKKGIKPGVKVAAGGAVLGAAGGAIIGSCQNPYMTNGVPTDTFARTAYDRYVKKADEAVRKSYGQYNEVINKINSVKTTDELKTLLNNNPEAAKEVSTALNTTTDEYLSKVTESNLSSNKATIKQKLESANQTRYQDMKNEISRCWDAEKKKFVKPDSVDNKIFKAIKRSCGQVRAKFIAKYAAIGAAVTGVISYAAYKIIKARQQNIQQ